MNPTSEISREGLPEAEGCPWCKAAPILYQAVNDFTLSCENPKCEVNPGTKAVPV